ncbi:sensor histidine kinase [Alicycliphilus denitrificans]|uniref:Virulence sensor protein BvgS n=1 Tax=Alicycliphilus denitrificans TaxID=179636 RepID=A0A420KC79_9BURK|nr:ATP-binding protein [Alicycliphilus denitrificans]RKJ96805.1 sensor histidine kinase [Alicycliphilus denitrificans]
MDRIPVIKRWQSKVGAEAAYSTTAYLFTACILLATWLASAALLHWQWQETLDAEVRENTTTALTLREYTQHILDSADNAMRRLQAGMPTDDVCKDIVRITNETGIAPHILTQLSFIGPDGRFRCSNLDPDGSRSRNVDLMDRAHVRVHLLPAATGAPLAGMLHDGLFISHALEGRVSGTWTIQMTRKVEGRDGSTRGVLVASLKQSHFSDVYRSAKLGPRGGVVLAGLDGVVRARAIEGGSPEADMLLPGALARLLGAHQDGATTSVSFDDLPRIVAYSRVGDYPLAVVSSTTQGNALATWRTTRNAIIVLEALLSLVVVGFVVLFLSSIRRLARSEAQAQSASRAKSDFLAAMSHELRTPLTSIRGFAELMELRSKDPLVREQSALIRQGAEHLNALLTEILDLAKVEAGSMPTHCEPVALPVLVHEVAELFRVSAVVKSLQLETRLHPAAGQPLVTDRLRLRQILNNLLSNAIKFTAQGRVELAVEPDADGRQMLFHVTDTGPGIAPELHEVIFEKFSQGNARVSYQHGGTGLGLSLSRALATLLGGTLTVQSSPGEGARFTLALPLQA